MEIYYARKTKVDRPKKKGYEVSSKQDGFDTVRLEKLTESEKKARAKAKAKKKGVKDD